MRGIPVERLIELHRKSSNTEHRFLYNWLIAQECQELQEPWIPIDEFLKSGFEGWCWINSNQITIAYKIKGDFYLNNAEADSRVYKIDHITHVMPIPKPEQPR